MKGINYVASVLRVYRQALDEYRDAPATWHCRPEWMAELGKMSHRGYTTGFLFGQPRNVGQEYDSAYIRSHEFVGVVEELHADGSAVVAVRNRLAAGDRLEIIGPAMRSIPLTLPPFLLQGADGELLPAEVAHPNQHIRLQMPAGVEACDLLRREKVQAA